MPWAAIMATAKAFAATAAGKAVISGATSAAATRLLRPKISKPRIDFKQMRDDAQSAGFNPLTAMRSGAMSGYMIPALSKQSFVGQFLSGAVRAAGDAFLNKDIDAYNAELRKLNLDQKRTNISLMKAQINEMNEADPLAGYKQGDRIPVKFGLQDFVIPYEIAKRLRIAPGDYVEAGVLQEIFGESAELFTAFAQEAFKDMTGITTPQLLGSRNNRKPQFSWSSGFEKRGDRARSLRGNRTRIELNNFAGTAAN